MGCFVVAGFLLTSAMRSPSAVAEVLVREWALKKTRSCAIAEGPRDVLISRNLGATNIAFETRGSAMADGPCDVLVSRNSATTKYPYGVALFS